MTPNECLAKVSSHILNFDGVVGMRRTRRLLRTLYPANFTNLLTLGATASKNVWFLNFTFPSPILEFTCYIRFWRFCGFLYITMRGLLLFSQETLQLKQGGSLISLLPGAQDVMTPEND